MLSMKKATRVEKKPASHLVMSLDKLFNETPPLLCYRQVVEPNSPPVMVTQHNKQLQTKLDSLSPHKRRNFSLLFILFWFLFCSCDDIVDINKNKLLNQTKVLA